MSGGQKQRLALARAILKNAGMYIFDEASSNIDVESEETIMNVIKSMAQNKTVILISHRMANVVTSDNIYLMNQGEVIESGNHEELMKLGGKYHRLIYFNEDGSFDAEFTNKEIEEVFSTVERAVIPGFYGIDHSGRIRTFSRGGSDITGSVIARGIKADLYENWTDISGSR